MKLKTYITENDISLEDFASDVGCSVHGLQKWIRGERIPRRGALAEIARVTGGQVTSVDFYEGASEGSAA